MVLSYYTSMNIADNFDKKFYFLVRTKMTWKVYCRYGAARYSVQSLACFVKSVRLARTFSIWQLRLGCFFQVFLLTNAWHAMPSVVLTVIKQMFTKTYHHLVNKRDILLNMYKHGKQYCILIDIKLTEIKRKFIWKFTWSGRHIQNKYKHVFLSVSWQEIQLFNKGFGSLSKITTLKENRS